MTDRHCGFVVALDQDLREDDSDAIIEAIKMIRGVVGVEPVVSGSEFHIANMRARTETARMLTDMIGKVLEG